MPYLFSDEGVLKALSFLGCDHKYELIPFLGGRNNAVYQLVTRKKKYLVKHYLGDKDGGCVRLKKEFNFYFFLNEFGIQNSPIAYYFDLEEKFAIYEFLHGRPLKREDIDEDVINRGVHFIRRLNGKRIRNFGKGLLNATDACFKLNDHYQLIQRKYDHFKTVIQLNDKKTPAWEQFFNETFTPIFENEKRGYEENIKRFEKLPHESLKNDFFCISPSDFGFHNALITENKEIVFIDFEYAGWDDPVKLVCDFLCQPDIPISHHYFSYLINEFHHIFKSTESFKDRVRLTLPMCHLKWCLIMLNEFLPGYQKRRKFALKSLTQKGMEGQLKRAKDYFFSYFGKR